VFFCMVRRPRRSPLFPYTTLFRSHPAAHARSLRSIPGERAQLPGGNRMLGPPVGELRVGGSRAVRAGAKTDRDEQDPHAIEFKRSEEHTSELQSRGHLVCRLLLEK